MKKASQIINLAKELGFFRKRTDNSKLQVAERIISTLEINALPRDLVDFLEQDQGQEQEPRLVSQVNHETEMPVLKGSRFVISAVQANTSVNAQALASLIQVAHEHDAELLLIPIKYSSTLEEMKAATVTYDPLALGYLLPNDVWLGRIGLVRVAAEQVILPTAKGAINFAASLNTGECLTVVGSPRAQIKTLPRAKNSNLYRWAYTSRVITERHYSRTRAGAEASADHNLGGVFISINALGHVAHQEILLNEQGQRIKKSLKAVVFGDLHSEQVSELALSRSLEMIPKGFTGSIILHDAFDHKSRNHHSIDSGFFKAAMLGESVEGDVIKCITIINRIARQCGRVFIVRSNHDDALNRWVDSKHYSPDDDPINALFYYRLKVAALEFIREQGKAPNLLELACKGLIEGYQVPDNVVFLGLDESLKIEGVELGTHGHNGTNGARGSANAFKALNVPIVTGHSHSPARNSKHVTVGVVGKLDMGYNSGNTTWDRANCLVYEGGHSVLVPLFDIGENQY